MSTTISLDFKTLALATTATTAEPVGSDPWNQQFVRLFGEETFKAYQASLSSAKAEEKKGLPNWAKTTAKVAGGVAGLGLVGGLGVLAYQHFTAPVPTGDGGGAETVIKALKRLF